MDFQTAVKSVLNNYANFQGRARRSEYWWFVLFELLVFIGLAVVDEVIFGVQLLSSLAALALFVPAVAVAVRRLHDTDRSGVWCLVSLIPLVGPFVMIWFCVQPGTRGPNQFGQDPIAV